MVDAEMAPENDSAPIDVFKNLPAEPSPELLRSARHIVARADVIASHPTVAQHGAKLEAMKESYKQTDSPFKKATLRGRALFQWSRLIVLCVSGIEGDMKSNTIFKQKLEDEYPHIAHEMHKDNDRDPMDYARGLLATQDYEAGLLNSS